MRFVKTQQQVVPFKGGFNVSFGWILCQQGKEDS